MEIYINLAKLLEDKGLTQKQLSNMTTIRPATIHSMVHNRAERIPLSNLAAICVALDCRIDDLLILKEGENE